MAPVRNCIGIASLFLFIGSQAFGFTPSRRDYSRSAISQILNNVEVIKKIPLNASVDSVERVPGKTLLTYDVKAGSCSITVELQSVHPKGFIGSGFPNHPKISDSSGCN